LENPESVAITIEVFLTLSASEKLNDELFIVTLFQVFDPKTGIARVVALSAGATVIVVKVSDTHPTVNTVFTAVKLRLEEVC